MTPLIADTSVLLKWLHTDRQDEVAAAGGPPGAPSRGGRHKDPGPHDLRAGQHPAPQLKEAANQLDDMLLLCGPALSIEPSWGRGAAELAQVHRLTFYDAVFAAAARGLGMTLASADRHLLASGLAESVTSWATRMT